MRRRTVALTSALAIAVSGAAGVALPAGASPHVFGAAPVLCAGVGIDSAAKVHYRGERLIHAAAEKAWNPQVDVESWPLWQRGAVLDSVRLGDEEGALRAGSQWRWTLAGGYVLHSTLRQIEDRRCLRWESVVSGPGSRITSIQVWTFTPVAGGVNVRTAESWTGDSDSDPVGSNASLAQGLTTWLDDLRKVAEGS